MENKEFGDNYLKKITRFLYKGLWCSWVHHKYKCWPRDPDEWHCMKCHECGEGLDIISSKIKFGWF